MCKGSEDGGFQKLPSEMTPPLREIQKWGHTVEHSPVILNKHMRRLRRRRRRWRTAVFPAREKSKIAEMRAITPKRGNTAWGLWLHQPIRALAWGKAAHSGMNSSRSLCKREQHMPTKSSGNITAWCIGMIYRHSFWLQSIYNP